MRILLNGESGNFTITNALAKATTTFEIIWLTSGQAYAEADILLLDMEALDYKGIDTFDQLHQRFPNLPIVLLANINQQEEALEAIRRGAMDCLIKSELSPTLLTRTLHFVCERYCTQQKIIQAKVKQYREILDIQTDLVFRFTPDYKLTYVNRAYGQYHNRLSEEMIGLNILDFITEEDRVRMEALAKSLNPTKSVGSSEDCHVLPDGSMKWLLWTNRALFDENEGIVEFQCIGRDITNLKQAEIDAREKNRLYRIVFENSVDGLMLTAADGRVIDVNPAACTLLGYTKEEICALDRETLVDKTDQPKLELLRKHAATGYSTGELTLIRKDGRKILTNATSQLFYDEKAQGLVSLRIRDITETKRLEEALRTSEELYRSLIESSDSIIALIDWAGRLHFLNEMGARQMRSKPSETIGKGVFELFPPENATSMLANIRQVLQSGQGIINETPIRIPGAVHWYRTSIQPVRNKEGQPILALINSSDITDLKLVEEKLRHSAWRLEGLNAIGEAILAAKTVEELGKLAIEQLIRLVPCQRATISSIDLTDNSLFPIHSWSQLETSVLPGKSYPINSEFLELIRVNPFILRTELDNYPAAIPRQLYQEGFTSMLYVGLKAGDELIGVLMLLSSDKAFFSEEFISIAVEIGDVLAIGITNASMNRKILEYSAELEENVALRTADLEQTRNRIEAIFQSSSDGILIIGANSEIELSNTQATALFGISNTKQKLVSLTDEADRPALDKALKEALLSGKIQRLEVSVKGSAENYFEAELGIAPVIGNKSDQPLLICTVRDITARKLAESAIHESEKRYRLLADNITDMVAVISPDGRYTYVSPSSKTLTGYAPEELVGKSSIEFIHPADLYELEAAFSRARVKRTSYNPMTARFRHKEGHYIWLETGGQTRYSEETDEPVSIITISRDVTRRKEVEEALAEERNLLRSLIDNLPDYIYVKDTEHRIILDNVAHARLLGKASPSEIVGKTVFDLFPPEFAEKYYADEEELYRTGQPIINREEKSLSLNRAIIWASTTKIPLKNLSGQIIGLVGITHDISELKHTQELIQQALEKEKELNELKSRFVSMASHEFRTPLTAILLAAEILDNYRQKMEEQEIEQQLNRIKRQVKYLANIIEDMLDLSRIQANRLEFKPVATDLYAFCNEIIEEFKSRPNISHTFSYTCETSPLLLNLDRTLMSRIINNLISNALKYSHPNTTIYISIKKQGDSIFLQIRDEGIGIPEADIKHLFEPFHRASNVGAISGTGLGLAIAKQSIEFHGGSISLESQPNIGTTVTLYIPDLS